MGLETKAGCRGCSSNSGRGGKGRGGHARTTLGIVPCKASEAGACKDLEGHIFTISSGNKGEDGDLLCATTEKMAT